MLTEKHLLILEALVDCIIPPDEYPGGWEAGVGDYLQKQFENDLHDVLLMYQDGLLALDKEAIAVYGKAFVDLTSDEQVQLLTQIEQANVQTKWAIDASEFFKQVVQHCAEGFYSDPGNGGNKNGISWEMIGYEVTA